jgi:putative spermidine/putrescine transport system permease protein
VIAISFTTTEYLKFPPEGLTLRWYWKVVSDPTFVEAFVVSGQLAAAATAMALLLGVPAALAFARKQFPGGRALSALFLSPLVLPTIVLGVASSVLGARLRTQLLGAVRRPRRSGDALCDPHGARLTVRHGAGA